MLHALLMASLLSPVFVFIFWLFPTVANRFGRNSVWRHFLLAAFVIADLGILYLQARIFQNLVPPLTSGGPLNDYVIMPEAVLAFGTAIYLALRKSR